MIQEDTRRKLLYADHEGEMIAGSETDESDEEQAEQRRAERAEQAAEHWCVRHKYPATGGKVFLSQFPSM